MAGLISPPVLMKKCPSTAAWGCLWALDMKLERGEGGAHAVGSYLWDDSVDGEAAN